MEKKQFQAESKRLLDLVVNSIYTNKDIFLRELISNASDAIDKVYYKALTDPDLSFNRGDYYIEIRPDKDNKVLRIIDTGLGMTREELESNLGTIAKSGSFDFKETTKLKDGYDVIGQFGVGFYSAFMVAENIRVISRSIDSDQAYVWESSGEDGYTISPGNKDSHGTEIILKIKEDTEEENYSKYLDENLLKSIIKRYSDYIRYPIRMEITKSRLKDNSEDEFEEYREVETINSMTPIWRQNKKDLKEEDYENFYYEKSFGFDKPLSHIHMKVDGLLRFNAILYIPSLPSYDFYTTDYEKGLELYSNSVLIMDKCSELLPDYFSFVKGLVDSEDLSLNISREMLQQDRQLALIRSNIENKIIQELKNCMKNKREAYEDFFQSFGRVLKFGMYNDFGKNKDKLEDLVLFYSSKNKSLVSLEEYKDSLKEDQKFIYYASGDSVDKVDQLPQVEYLKEKGYEVLYLVDDIDEFTIKITRDYRGLEFKSVDSDDLGIDIDGDQDEIKDLIDQSKDLFKKMEGLLENKVGEIKPTNRLKSHPVSLINKGDISIEMEKTLKNLPENEDLKIEKIMEVNVNHPIFEKLKSIESDEDSLKLYLDLLYDQARLMEGLDIEDPVAFANNICKLM